MAGIPVVAWLAFSGGVALGHRRRVWQVLRGADAAADDLSLFEALLRELESEQFSASRLSALRVAFDGQARPSVLIARLRRLIAVRDLLRNELARPFGLLLLVRSQTAVAIDRWHRQHQASLLAWIAFGVASCGSIELAGPEPSHSPAPNSLSELKPETVRLLVPVVKLG